MQQQRQALEFLTKIQKTEKVHIDCLSLKINHVFVLGVMYAIDHEAMLSEGQQDTVSRFIKENSAPSTITDVVTLATYINSCG